MNENMNILISFFTGLVIGALFFYGLWITLTKLTTLNMPSLWVFGSSLFRIMMSLAGLSFVIFLDSEGQLKRVILFLFGFLIARYLMTKIVNFKSIEEDHAT